MDCKGSKAHRAYRKQNVPFNPAPTARLVPAETYVTHRSKCTETLCREGPSETSDPLRRVRDSRFLPRPPLAVPRTGRHPRCTAR